MDRQQVDSSNIASIGYDPKSLVMEIEFRNGMIYQYFDVPQHAYEDLVNAASVGSHFHHNIRGQYSYARI